jgi:cation diffusion facilitator CzcD-associated flavoprotein CzcO
LRGRRVGVIGTGSTGVQITCALAGVASEFKLFQRTAQWVVPVANPRYSRLNRALHRHLPALSRASYRYWQRQFELLLGHAVIEPGWQRTLVDRICRLNLRFGVRDPELRRKLTPDYRPMCKRLVMSAASTPPCRSRASR